MHEYKLFLLLQTPPPPQSVISLKDHSYVPLPKCVNVIFSDAKSFFRQQSNKYDEIVSINLQNTCPMNKTKKGGA